MTGARGGDNGCRAKSAVGRTGAGTAKSGLFRIVDDKYNYIFREQFQAKGRHLDSSERGIGYMFLVFVFHFQFTYGGN